MFASPIGRGRYFAYSAALFVAEAIAVILCISLTLGVGGLAESPPGPGREPLALSILLVSIVFFLARAAFAWGRTRDAEGSKWVLWMYIVFSAFFALLQAGTFLVYDFRGGDNSNIGLNLLGLVLIGLWLRILIAPSTGGTWDPHSFAAAADAEVRARAGIDDRMTAATASPAPAPLRSTPAARPAAGTRRAGGFGRRGIA